MQINMQKEMFKTLAKVKNNNSLLITKGVYLSPDVVKRNNTQIEIAAKPSFKVVGEGVISDFAKLKKISEKVSIISVEFSEHTAKVKTAKGEFKLATNPAEDFPFFSDSYLDIGEVSLDEKFQTACKFVSKDELRPGYQQVAFNNGKIYSTNSHILYFEAHENSLSAEFIIQGDYNFIEGKFSVKSGKTYNQLVNDDYTFTYRKFDGILPGYDSVIPVNVPNKVVLTKKELIEKVELALLGGNSHTKKIDLDGNVLGSCDVDKSTEYKATLKFVESVGEPFCVSLNGKLLMSIIKEIKEENITIEHFGESLKPIIINKRFLLMPIMR